MTKTVYPDKPQPAKPTTEEKRRANALSLYEQGYRAKKIGISKVDVTTPKGDVYTVDTDFETCTCQGWYHSYRKGNPTCKHVEGAELLLVRCERHPLTPELVAAAKGRDLRFTCELPRIMARFDNGVHSGDLEILRSHAAYFADGVRIDAVVRRADGRELTIALSEFLTVDGITFDHLTRVAALRRAEKQREDAIAIGRIAAPVSGTYRQGNTRNWTGGGYR